MTRYIMTIIVAIGLACALVLAAVADAEQAQAELVSAKRGPK